MALDPRLADPLLLALAARRAKARQATAPNQAVVLQIEYDAYGDEPPLKGEQYVLYLSEKAPSVEAWYKATARFRESPRPAPGADAC